MTLLDMSAAQGLRVGNVDAQALRIANVDVWTAEAPPTRSQHSIFGATVPGVLGQYDDGVVGGWMAHQFYSSSFNSRPPMPGGVTIDAVRYYVAEGSPLIGVSGEVSINRLGESAPQWFGPGGAHPDISAIGDLATTGALTATGPLVAGWNRIPLAGGPHPWPGIDLGVVCGIRFPNPRYQYNATVISGEVQEPSGLNYWLADRTGNPSIGKPSRSFYTGNSSVANWYGLDLEIGVPA